MRMDLVANGDIDIQLWITRTGEQLTGDGGQHLTESTYAEKEIDGATYEYSGWSGNEEWIQVHNYPRNPPEKSTIEGGRKSVYGTMGSKSACRLTRRRFQYTVTVQLSTTLIPCKV